MHPAAVRHDVKNCARCKGDHSLIYFQPYHQPAHERPLHPLGYVPGET